MAQSSAGAGGTGSIVAWVIVLMLAAIVGFWAAMMIRKRALSADDEESTEGLTLGALRDMHARGDLDDEEYERARAAILARAGVNPDKARPLSAGPDRDEGFTRRAGPGVDLTGAPLPEPGRKDRGDSGQGAN
jgi:hypothetical protein